MYTERLCTTIVSSTLHFIHLVQPSRFCGRRLSITVVTVRLGLTCELRLRLLTPPLLPPLHLFPALFPPPLLPLRTQLDTQQTCLVLCLSLHAPSKRNLLNDLLPKPFDDLESCRQRSSGLGITPAANRFRWSRGLRRCEAILTYLLTCTFARGWCHPESALRTCRSLHQRSDRRL